MRKIRSTTALILAGMFTAVLMAPASAAPSTDAASAGQSFTASQKPKVVDKAFNPDGALVLTGVGDNAALQAGAATAASPSNGPTAPSSDGGAFTTMGGSCTSPQLTSWINTTGWKESQDGCSIIGYNNTATYTYSWRKDQDVRGNMYACVQVRGYYTDQSVSTPLWFNNGCQSPLQRTAHIGNRATVTKVRGHVDGVGFAAIKWN